MNAWKIVALISLIAVAIIAYKKNFYNKFVPLPENCGAAMSARGIQAGTFLNGLACLKAGYKDVYLGNIVTVLFEYIPEEYAKKEIQIIVEPDGNFILYTQKGAQNAQLLVKAREENISNDYLNGHLLGYKEEDIKFFYDRNQITTLDQDKKDATEWLEKHS
jgi:hypothetical protein